jgi:hypothetical protein
MISTLVTAEKRALLIKTAGLTLFTNYITSKAIASPYLSQSNQSTRYFLLTAIFSMFLIKSSMSGPGFFTMGSKRFNIFELS